MLFFMLGAIGCGRCLDIDLHIADETICRTGSCVASIVGKRSPG